ncbi:FUSC family protein [Nocardioides campestrisoli]|uniref:FUSC family protein n=1 Tax=Nocardioides campestrisoli TaxID=2736757 RepID=UPI00163D760F|nr:FUSC family protein [Nocardioides campestrisoli]
MTPDDSDREQDRKRPGGSPVVLVLMLVVVVPAVVLADSWGAGAAGIVGGLTGLFSLIAFIGGPLRSDLRLAAVLAPLLVFAAVVPRSVAEVSRPAAIALVVLLGFVAALLPLGGGRLTNAGLGLGMTTMFGYGYAINGTADHVQLVVAAVAGVLVALALRLLLGATDPSGPTRQQVAAVLVADSPASATTQAFDTWLGDGRPRWLADVLEGASRYRLAMRAAELSESADATELAALRARAEWLATRVRARPGTEPPPAPAGLVDDPVPQATNALDAVEQAVETRDTTPVRLDHDARRKIADAVLHPSARLRSVQVRHALRTALGLLVMLLITAPLSSGDPLVSTVLLATFSILQSSWRDTLTKARNKVVGVSVGSLAVAVILLVAPSGLLAPIAGVCLCLGLWFISTRPAVGSGFMVMVSVGFNAVSRDLDPVELLAQYVGLTAAAVVVSVVLGFAVVPAFRAPPLRRRIESATGATAAVLRASSLGSGTSLPDQLALRREAAQQQDELVPDHDQLDDRQLDELDRLRTSLRDLTTLVDARQLAPDAMEPAIRSLVPTAAEIPSYDGQGRRPPGGVSSILWDVAQQAGAAETYLLRTLPPDGAR